MRKLKRDPRLVSKGQQRTATVRVLAAARRGASQTAAVRRWRSHRSLAVVGPTGGRREAPQLGTRSERAPERNGEQDRDVAHSSQPLW
jgi:hypothetical protein